ncbi:hypothetical protein N4T77_12615 [Clostridium sp. CX1]|uniref:hypothetical protein n=1 Tax=Clostridium sp. CX1 TaxID=2978346 RepID=UPI0021BFA11B|nr:hypothetical protein [Clostridium sp. CX1]MCT8977446.1 hypothetical protein [Clostridium sp. CX1]
MKTISEMENDIKDISIKLEGLLKGLENLKPKDNINNQTDFMKISRLAEQYPIREHSLEEADNYKKKLYLTMLSAISQTNNDNREEKLVFLHRILSGIKYEGSLESVVKDGMAISDKTIGEFIKCMEDSKSKQLFIFESLIISNLGGEIDDIAKKYISDLIGFLGITKEEAIFLIKLSAVVLEQSNSKYKELVNTRTKTVDTSIFVKSYLKDFVTGVICDTESMYYAYDMDADEEMISSISGKYKAGIEVVFENVRFNLETANEDLIFRECNSVLFNNCSFKSHNKNINFKGAEEILFYNCKISGFNNRVCLFDDECKDIKFEKCTFEKCGYWRDKLYSEQSGGCFYILKINSFILKDSEFINCYIENRYTGQNVWGAIAYIKQVNNFEVNNVRFSNSHCVWPSSSNVNVLWKKDTEKEFVYGGNLFEGIFKKEHFINCKTINSARLY